MSELTNNDVIDQFWDMYQETGIVTAVNYIQEQANGSLTVLETSVPYLVEEAKKRSIDIIDFLQELDDHMEKQDASGTNNGGPELPSDSSSEDNRVEDENVSAPTRDADAEGGDSDQSV